MKVFENQSLSIQKNDSTYVFQGMIDETFDATIGPRFPEANLHFNFRGVLNINSSGILHFITLLRGLNPDQRVIFEEVPTMVVTQMGLTRGFISARFSPQSFYVPYCAKGSEEQVMLLLTIDEVRSGKLPMKKHPVDGTLLEPDLNPDKFLHFLKLLN